VKIALKVVIKVFAKNYSFCSSGFRYDFCRGTIPCASAGKQDIGNKCRLVCFVPGCDASELKLSDIKVLNLVCILTKEVRYALWMQM